MKKYKTRISSIIPEEKVNVYGFELEKIKKKYNKLTTVDIVTEAMNKNNPLHDYFEWDNSVAGKKWREQQARLLVSTIVEVVTIDGQESEQRSYYSVPDEDDSENRFKYVTLQEATKNNQYREQLLQKIISHLENTTMLMKMFKNYK